MNNTISFKNLLQSIAKSLMLPITILPIAGLLLGLGSFFTTPEVLSYLNLTNLFEESFLLKNIFFIFTQIGNVIFSNLPIIFAVCVAREISYKEKSSASIIAVISFLVMNQTIFILLSLTNKLKFGMIYEGSLTSTCGIESLNTGIFGGIAVGLLVALIQNKFINLKPNNRFSFLEGTKFSLCISVLASIVMGLVIFFVWIILQNGVYSLVKPITNSRYAGTLIYGLMEQFLKPFGLNEILSNPFLETTLGGSEIIDGHYITGSKNIFFAELLSSKTVPSDCNIMRFMSGNFPFMMFGLPSALLAIYQTSELAKKKYSMMFLFSAITCILVGVTEPLEYIFLFSAPLLYGVHCILVGISFMLMRLLKVAIGTGFSGGFMDFLFFGMLPGNNKTHWIYGLCLGIAYAFVYYFTFKFIIRKFKLTPVLD